MHIAIVDDCQQDCLELQALLGQYCAQKQIAVTWGLYQSGEAFVDDFTPGKFQLLFLDIYMDGLSGMDVARQVYAQDPACLIIFATTSHLEAVASYEVHAAWYLIKPIELPRLFTAMDTVCKDMFQDQRAISLHSESIPITIRLGDILYADCSKSRLCLHLTQGQVLVDEKVQSTLSALTQDERFLLCNRNVVVNMDWVERLAEGAFVLQSGQQVPIRLRGQAAVKKDFLQYSLRNLKGGQR